jgi:hypothetical protein
MTRPTIARHARKQIFIAGLIVTFLLLFAGHFYLYAQDKSDFPDGYDAMPAASGSHKVILRK